MVVFQGNAIVSDSLTKTPHCVTSELLTLFPPQNLQEFVGSEEEKIAEHTRFSNDGAQVFEVALI